MNNTKYPGIPTAMNGYQVVKSCAQKIYECQSTQDISSTVGLAMTGLRSGCYVSGKNLIKAHDSLLAAAGKHLPLVVNVGCGALLKSVHSFHAGHDAYHAVSDSGFVQLFAKNVQEVADLNLIAHRVAELALSPVLVAQDQVLTSETIQSLFFPEADLIEEYLGNSDDDIESPTPAQQLVFGKIRQRIPALWNMDQPMSSGAIHNQRSYESSMASGFFYSSHAASLIEQAMREYHSLTGRFYSRVSSYKMDDADYVFVGQGSAVEEVEVIADYLRRKKNLKVGVLNLTTLRPFPSDLVSEELKNRKGVIVFERLGQTFSEDLPLIREIRAALSKGLKNVLPVYSASFGMGGQPLKPEQLIAAIENILPTGRKLSPIYLGLKASRRQVTSPKQEIQQQAVLDAYPHLKDLVISGTENPDLLPKDAFTVQLCSVGNRDFFAVSTQVAGLMSELTGKYLKGRSKNKPEIMGQPTTYNFILSSEPVKVDSAYAPADVTVISDPRYVQSLKRKSLKEKGTLVIQTGAVTSHDVWKIIPRKMQQAIIEKNIKVLTINVEKIIKEEKGDNLKVKEQILLGILIGVAGISKPKKGGADNWDQMVNANLVKKVVDCLDEIKKDEKVLTPESQDVTKEEEQPIMLKDWPESKMPVADLHRFWVQTGHHYSTQCDCSQPADPFIATGIMPAASGLFRDFSSSRKQHPVLVPEKCTGCGDCWVVCPDSALPPMVHELGQLFETTIASLEKLGHEIKHLPRTVRSLEGALHQIISRGELPQSLQPILNQAINQAIVSNKLGSPEKEELKKELTLFKDQLNNFQASITHPYYGDGKGGFLSITINPDKCKGCMECVKECPEGALVATEQTKETLSQLKKKFVFWQNLSNTDRKFIQTENLEKDKAYTSLLLDKKAYHSMVGGDEAIPGSSKKTVMHLFTSITEGLMRSRLVDHKSRIDTLTHELEKHIKLKLSVNVVDTQKLDEVIEASQGEPLTLTELSDKLDKKKDPIDTDWLKRVTKVLAKLKKVGELYSEENRDQSSNLGVVGNVEHESSWSASFPYNPFSFPWTQHLLSESPSVALGLFEGHMKKFADQFKAIRMAELELADKYNSKEHDSFYNNFCWRHLTDEEFMLCPPVVIVGTNRTLYRQAFQNLTKMLGAHVPIKILILDTLKLPAHIPLIGLSHRNTYVLQGGMGNVPHMVQGFIDGLNIKHPALFHIFCSQVEKTDAATEQARLALKSRAHVAFSYHPERGNAPHECLSLEGNEAIDQEFPSHIFYSIDESGQKISKEISLTFADFAVTEGTFSQHFKQIVTGQKNESLIPLHELLEIDLEDRAGKTPFIWSVDNSGKLIRLEVLETMVQLSEERRGFWNLLKSFVRMDLASQSEEAISARAQGKVIERITQSLVELAYI